MCGIAGYIGKELVDEEVINILSDLEYRGYDSAGVAVVDNNEIIVTKSAGKIDNLRKILPHIKSAGCGIGHTRWATHGKPSEVNAHPHSSNNSEWAVVHNGIIENFDILKGQLESKNVTFKSQTDTEVIAQLLAETNENNILNVINVCSKLKGSYALAIINKNNPDKIYLARNKSPLYVAIGNKGVYIASDTICFANKANNYYQMLDGEFCVANDNGLEFFDNQGNKIDKQEQQLNEMEIGFGKLNYPHFMIKEINEVPAVLNRILTTYSTDILSAKLDKNFLDEINNIYIVGCGTAYHAGLMGVRYLETFAKIRTSCFIASEFRYSNPIIDDKTLCIFISQSGETADTLGACEIAKTLGAKTIALTNVAYSSISKMVDIVLPVCAGPEIAVASTKAYTAQITEMYMIARHIANVKLSQSYDYLKDVENLAKNYTPMQTSELEDLAQEIVNETDMFLIGRDRDYVTANEGSLKLKEITYINCTAYPSGELKHGFLALIEEGTYLFVVATEKDLLDKTLNGAHEALARGAKLVLLTQFDLEPEKLKGVHKVITLPKFNEELMPMASIGVFQTLSYMVSVKKGINPDQPRNLAKSVTVE